MLQNARPLKIKLEAHWTNVLAITCKTGRSDFITMSRAILLLLIIGSLLLAKAQPLIPILCFSSSNDDDWSDDILTSWK